MPFCNLCKQLLAIRAAFSESPVKNVTSKRQSEAQQVYMFFTSQSMEACNFTAVLVDIPLI